MRRNVASYSSRIVVRSSPYFVDGRSHEVSLGDLCKVIANACTYLYLDAHKFLGVKVHFTFVKFASEREDHER